MDFELKKKNVLYTHIDNKSRNSCCKFPEVQFMKSRLFFFFNGVILGNSGRVTEVPV